MDFVVEVRAGAIAASIELPGARPTTLATVLFVGGGVHALAPAAGLPGIAAHPAPAAVLFIREIVYASSTTAALGIRITGAPAVSAVVFIRREVRALADATVRCGIIAARATTATVFRISQEIHAFSITLIGPPGDTGAMPLPACLVGTADISAPPAV